MTTSNYMPDVKVEIAFNAGYSTPAASRTWTDVSSYVELADSIDIARGRADEFTVPEANSLSLTLDNTDGRFTADRAASPYYPNVKLGRPIKVTATPVGGVASIRFLGYVDEWPVEWDGSDKYASAKISARSRLARLGFDAELRSSLATEINAGQPLHYWPLAGEDLPTTLVDTVTTNPAPLTSELLTPLLNQPAGLIDPEIKGVTFAGDNQIFANRHMKPFSTTSSGSGFTLETVLLDGDGDAVVLRNTNDYQQLLTLLAYGDGRVRAWAHDGTTGVYATSGYVALDGAAHHCAAYVHYAAGSTTIDLYIDGVLAATDTEAVALLTFNEIEIGGFYEGTMSNVAITLGEIEVAERAQSVVGGVGESASDRIIRYAGYAGIPSGEVVADSGTSPIEDIQLDGLTALAAMRKVEEAENGVLFDARDNTLRFMGRASRYNSASMFTLSAALQQVESEITPKLDRSTLVNDVTVTASDGSTTRAISQPSIDAYGSARVSLDLPVKFNEVEQAAIWRVGMYAEPRSRVPALGVDLLAFSLIPATSLLTADVGTRFTVSGLPSQASASSLDFFIEGYSEQISTESYTLTFNVSPRTGEYDVWILEDPTYGAYDTYGLAY